jgi:hypothetical protein
MFMLIEQAIEFRFNVLFRQSPRSAELKRTQSERAATGGRRANRSKMIEV